MKTILKNISLLLLLSNCPVFAQTIPVQDSLLDNMVGEWILQDTIAGQETTHDIAKDI